VFAWPNFVPYTELCFLYIKLRTILHCLHGYKTDYPVKWTRLAVQQPRKPLCQKICQQSEL
jgi:hypothetical protein